MEMIDDERDYLKNDNRTNLANFLLVLKRLERERIRNKNGDWRDVGRVVDNVSGRGTRGIIKQRWRDQPILYARAMRENSGGERERERERGSIPHRGFERGHAFRRQRVVAARPKVKRAPRATSPASVCAGHRLRCIFTFERWQQQQQQP